MSMLRNLFLLFLFLSINISITAQSKETKYVSSNGGQK